LSENRYRGFDRKKFTGMMVDSRCDGNL